jgi:hypothetical protein
MRSVVALLVVSGLAASGLVASASAASSAPRLRIVSSSPLVLRGSSFGPRERVKLTVTLGTKTQTWTSRAGLLGTFLARFPDLVYDRCHGALKVSAVGGRGHRAGFTLQPLPCPDSATSVKTD